MSGHSKWSTIKHKKGALDAKRGKIFTKIVKELTVAARDGGGDPDANPKLRLVVAKAKAANMPSDNITRAIKKGTGEIPGVVYESITYEGYGPGGVAIMVECLTDNKNRSSSEVRTIMSKRSGNMAGAGSVAWQFEMKGLIVVPKSATDEESLMEAILEAGAEDVVAQADSFEITTAPSDLDAARAALETHNIAFDSAEITMLPTSTVKVEKASEVKSLVGLLSALEESDDVQNVYANFDISDELLAEVEGE